MARPKKKIDAGGTKKKRTVKIANNAKSASYRTEAQNAAAAKNLQKAREAKKRYYELRKEGFSRSNVNEAIDIINTVLNRTASFKPENNPAVAKYMAEINYNLPTKEQIESMSNSDYYKFATATRAFLNHPLSDESALNTLQDRLINKILGKDLLQDEGESKPEYLYRRNKFIRSNKDVASKAFEIYRRLESTHAGLILRGKISPEAYGSDNLIVDLFDFVENDLEDYNDIEAATNYWQEQLENQYAFEEEYKEKFQGKEVTKFDWQGREKYAAFARRKGWT